MARCLIDKKAHISIGRTVTYARDNDQVRLSLNAPSSHNAMTVARRDALYEALANWTEGEPRFIGDALADPLTGLLAATQALEAVNKATAGLINVALVPTAGFFAGFMVR